MFNNIVKQKNNRYNNCMKFTIPLRVKVSKNKYFILNMNNYRNAHHRVLSTAKRNFTDIILNMELPKIKYERIRVHYKVYPASNRRYDIMNVISVVDKFLTDAVIKRGIVPEDNTRHVLMPTAEACAPCPENPRIEVVISEE